MAPTKDDLQRENDSLRQDKIDNENKYQIIKINERTWRLLAIEHHNYLFANNVDDVVKVRFDVAILLSNHHSFRGQMEKEANIMCFYIEKKLIAKVPMSLMDSLTSGKIKLPEWKGS